MRLRDRRFYPWTSGAALLAFWLAAAAVFAFPTWRQAVLIGSVAGLTTAWSMNLQRERRLRGQREQDMGLDYRA